MVMIAYIIVAIVAFDAGFLAAAILAASARADHAARRMAVPKPQHVAKRKVAIIS